MSEPALTWEQTSDGSYSIRGVPIFELGVHRGFQYDESWARRVLQNFARLKTERRYLPPVILGHTKSDDEEKPAVGFVDRLRLVGKRLVADLTGIGGDLFTQVREGRWPYRSVEVFDRAAQITALALLGGTAPHMKTAPLHFDDDGGAGVWIDGAKLPRLSEQSRRDSGGSMEDNKNTSGAGSAGDSQRFTREDVDRFIEETRDTERTKFAVTESELTKTREDLQSTRTELTDATERLQRMEADARESDAQSFRADLAACGYVPALIESPEMTLLMDMLVDGEPVRFRDQDVRPMTVFREMLGLIAQRGQDGSAFVDSGEVAEKASFTRFAVADDDSGNSRFSGVVDPGSLERYRQARELATSEGIPFRDALQRVVSNTNGVSSE
jgi:hypothetical protein